MYQNKELEQIPKLTIGFIYRIINQDSLVFYIGKKLIWSTVNKKLGKKEAANLPTKRGRNPTTKKVITESNWRNYYGSSKPLLEDIKRLGKDKFIREILLFCDSKRDLTYQEVKYQFQYNVLEVDSYNNTILGKFYRQ